jgi:hypothetical protein
VPALRLVRFSGPPSEPGERLSPHRALHRFMPLGMVLFAVPMVSGCSTRAIDTG